jgi:hypothetical protein
MEPKGLKFLLIFSTILLILSTSNLADTAQGRCKPVGKFKEKFMNLKLIAIYETLTT